MKDNMKSAFSNFGSELLESIRGNALQRLNDAAFEERIIGIEKAVAAMIDVGINDDKIVQMLQKHWDLRLSEANKFITSQHATSE